MQPRSTHIYKFRFSKNTYKAEREKLKKVLTTHNIRIIDQKTGDDLCCCIILAGSERDFQRVEKVFRSFEDFHILK